MPVSFFPLLVTALLVGAPLVAWAMNRRAGLVAGGVSAALVGLVVLPVYINGWRLEATAGPDRPELLYEYARWQENHCSNIQSFLFWPCDTDVVGGFRTLQRAAEAGHPKSTWLVGVRLKHGIHVPKPDGWDGPGGNVFKQPERGQRMIDRAVDELGFEPPVGDQPVDGTRIDAPDSGPQYYWRVYRD
jgi:hypothetical protein